MKKRIEYLSEEKLRELSQKDNVTVMQPTHDVIFEPWTSESVESYIYEIRNITLENKKKGIVEPEKNRDIVKKNKILEEFSQKYQVLFAKLTDPIFAEDDNHFKTILQLVKLKQSLENNEINHTEAQSKSSDIVMNSLLTRIPK